MNLVLNRFISVASVASIFLFTSGVYAQKCTDSPLPFTYGSKNQIGICKDIGGKIDKSKCKNEAIASHCPKSCGSGACKEFKCDDSAASFTRKGVNRNCAWLDGMSKKKRERRCESRRIKKTCRATCSYCEGGEMDAIDFDEVTVVDFDEYEGNEENSFIFGNTIAINSTWAEDEVPELPWDEVTTTKPNLGATDDPFNGDPVAFGCLGGGSFDLKAMTLGAFYSNSTEDISAEIGAYDKDFNFVGSNIVGFDDIGEVKYVEFSPIFKDISVVTIGNTKGPVAYAFDTIEVVINSPCEEYYESKAGTLFPDKRLDRDISTSWWQW